MTPGRRARCIAMLAGCAAAYTIQARAQPFSSPVGCEDCISFWYYLDHGNNTDYACESATYSNHNGTDFSLRGGNARIDDGNEVLAAAAGIVRTVSDGNYDRCTECGGSGCGTNTPGGGFSNYVVIDHGSHDTTYGHMRSGSISVQEGDSVECGMVIGHIGSAGCSTGAHLHFQPRPAGGSYVNNPLDPYQGDCSPTEPSLWGQQGPHRGLPGHTCNDQPSTPTCPADSFELWTCSEDGASRRRCIDGVDSTEDCAYGCDEMPTGTDDVCALPPDADEDGVRADTDCDDTRADVHPGALETCGDDVDQDCSGADAPCEPDSGTAGTSTNGASTSSGGALATAASSENAAASSAASDTTGASKSSATASLASTGGQADAASGSVQTSAGTTHGSAGTLATTTASAVGGASGTLGSDSGAPPGTGTLPPQAAQAGCACRVGRPSSAPREVALLGLLGMAFGRRRRFRTR